MDGFLILGNQLFDPKIFPKLKSKPIFFMREDSQLCTHFKYHKLKIHFFLSAMRKYSKELNDHGYEVKYSKINTDQLSYTESLHEFVKNHKIENLHVFEIEDKFFENIIFDFAKSNKIQLTIHKSPMFLTGRSDFKKYLSSTKKPFMKTFYESQRKTFKILVDEDSKPIGGQWSFDEENRKSLVKNYSPPGLPLFTEDSIDRKVSAEINSFFKKHPGNTSDCWLPTDRKSAQNWLNNFLQNRIENFGPYEDAFSAEHDFINHSVLTPFLNTGLLTPSEVVKTTLSYAKKNKIPLNSLEGFIRQIIGWREFIRGIYQNYSEKQDTTNFWNHTKKMTPHWYEGNTGIEPLDQVIKKTNRIGYAHHIERLMVLGSLMLLLELEPQEAHRWFMEMYIDSSDWVMGPNVYGMALFSDGGLFATKPYFCGSNYYKKMGKYKDSDWQDGVDGLYWSFIEKNKLFFKKNPRMSMMASTVEKMPADKKKRIYAAADILRNRLTI